MTDWVIRVKKDEYRARDREMVLEWVREGRVPFESQIFDPDKQRWQPFRDFVIEMSHGVLLTTTGSLDGYRVIRYIDIESVEFVIGTGLWSEFTGEWSDFFGARSTVFEQKLQRAKAGALNALRVLAAKRGGNAVIGVDLDYTEFSGNRIGLIANGTIVLVEARPLS